MAAIAVEPVIVAITAIVEAAVEKGVEASVIAAISAAVTSVVEEAVASAIEAAIIAGITSSITATITESTTEAIEKALGEKLDQSVKEVIGSQGVNDLAKAISALPSDVVVNKLADAAFEAINPHLWVFQDPAFFRLTKVIRALRAVERGDEPPHDDDDDDCDEEKCRFFEAPKVEDDLEDFVFLSVFRSEECKEGDEVYSMFVQMKNLKSLVEDPVGGHFVSQMLQEINERCVEEDEEHNEDDAFLQAGIAKPTVAYVPKIKKKIVKAKYGNLVPFGSKTIYNIKGSSADKRSPNWLKASFVKGYQKCGKCYIKEASPNCGHTNPLQGNIVGGHVWNPALKKQDKSLRYYILPICKRHNKHGVYDEPKPKNTGWMRTTADAWAMQIKSTSNVPGWKGDKLMAIAGFQSFAMMVGKTDGDAGECHEITQPKQLTKWLLEEVHKIALEFAKDPINVVFKEVSGIVFGKLKEIIQSAGSDAENWAKSEGHDIMLQSLIPFYGIYQAIKRLSSLKSDAIGRFHSEAQSALANYKNECLGDVEQARRKQRLSEETDKVLSSKKWKDRVVAFEKTIASKVSTVINLEKNN
ncbi:uncharacterized protein [Montipora capricornis]|uniref:uncharacterized protein n=1 Tax=Montipora capricornis TaxID=246305 RepID=UPI0035F16A2C